MNVTLVEVLTGFEEVGISLLELSSFDHVFLLFSLLVTFNQLAVSRIDGNMQSPKALLDSSLGGIFEGILGIVEDDTLGSSA